MLKVRPPFLSRIFLSILFNGIIILTLGFLSLQITFTTVDRRKCPLQGDIRIQSFSDDLYMISFRKSKGDPIEFKRFYKAVVGSCEEIVAK
jgi:serine/threonine-protein kinase Chk1